MLSGGARCIVYTGAGISTAASLPDYRGPKGVWTMQAKGETAEAGVSIEQARPTFAHMAVAALVRASLAQMVVSTNVDCLHLRSGVPEAALFELHGNLFKEVCSQCNAPHLREAVVQSAVTCGGLAGGGSVTGAEKHLTGGICSACGGALRDCIVNFGEDLSRDVLAAVTEHSRNANVALVLGTTLSVFPASELPLEVFKAGGKLVICNLQRTGYDGYSRQRGVRVFATADDFMLALVQKLGIEVQPHSEGSPEACA
eukprot:NODE_7391_length_1583_cov_4.217720.p2 GENE.NODE_7391_length_1583_cov_4.217720~~NODE_7391_length_1583_cov_4.217720.p2  ORF type:complete len:264 (-),score=101.95 NODE_7391_length_1583_cov_4.217720:790-1560(-)